MTPVDYALGGVGALSSIIGTGMSNSTNKKIARENRAWSEAMWDKQSAWQEQMVGQQQDWQEMMWNKENEYNTASAQIQRLIDAGINPNNAAGLVSNGAAGMPSAPSVPMPASMPTQNPIPSQPYDISGGLRLAADMSMMEKEKEKISSDIEVNNASIKELLEGKLPYEQAQRLLAMSQKELNEAIESGVTIGNTFLAEKSQAEIDKIYAEINKLVEEEYGVHLSNEQAIYTLNELMPLQKRLYNSQIKQVISEIVKNYAEAKNAQAQATKAYAEAGLINVQTQQLSAQTGAVEAEAALRKEQAIQSVAQLKKWGVPISQSQFDALTKQVLYIQNAQNCSIEDAGDIVIGLLDASKQWSGYYMRHNLNARYGSGNANWQDHPIGVGMYGTDEVRREINGNNRANNYVEEYRRNKSKGDWNPSDRNKGH